MDMPETPYLYPDIYPTRKRRPYLVGTFSFLFVLLLSLATGLIQFHLYTVYQTYQQGFCTIESGTTEYHSTKSGSYYTPDFQYTVHTGDGQQAEASGYDAPTNAEYDTQDEARQVVDSYNIGQTYSCWYNPADPTHAVLVYYGYSTSTLVGNYIATVVLSFIGYLFLWFLLYYTFYRQLCLIRRGVQTQGKVVSTLQRSTRSGRKTYSRVVFSPVDDPSRTYRLDIAGAYPVGSPQTVCYDPRNPKNVQSGDRPHSGCAAFALLGFVVGTLLMAAILLGVWYSA